MRLKKLDLLRYGRFTDTSFEFPQAERDFHVIFGPNEAGKSTTLSAIEDLLYGIPARSPYNFLHSYESMRVGALLEDGGKQLEFQRRKTRRGAIVGTDGIELAGNELELAPFLGGTDREFFSRMFNLSHSRLAEGGRAILDAKDDVGQLLFAAGTGLANFRDRLRQLESESNDLWSPRRSKERRYYQAEDRFKAAESKRRDRELKANAWRQAERALSKANEKLEERKRDHAHKSGELRKLSRIRRVYGLLQQHRDLTEAIASLGSVTLLPEDATEQVNQARNQDSETKAVLKNIEPDLEADQERLASIEFDEGLVKKTDEIRLLDELYITARKGRMDLSKRQAELQYALNAMAQLADDIGWKIDEPTEIADRIPSRSEVGTTRNLIIQYGEIAERVRNAQDAVEESRRQLKTRTESLKETGNQIDVSPLAAVLASVKKGGDVAGRIRTTKSQADSISKEIDKKLRTLNPALKLQSDFDSLVIPSRDAVIKYRDDYEDLARRRSDNKHRLDDMKNKLDQDQATLVHRIQNEGALEPDALVESRIERDALWKLVFSHYIEGSELSTDHLETYVENLDQLADAYENAVRNVDTISDRRFDQAHTSAELAVLARNIANYEVQIEQSNSLDEELEAESERLVDSWKTLWSDIPLDGSLPEPYSMLTWLDVLRDVLSLRVQERDLHRKAEESTVEERQATTVLYDALKEIQADVDGNETRDLGVLIEKAEACLREQETRSEKIREIKDSLRTASLDLNRRESGLSNAESDLADWEEEWKKAIAAIHIQTEGAPDSIVPKITLIDELREQASKATNIKERRIETIEKDIKSFEETTAELVQELAPDLAGKEFEVSAIELKRRHEEALKTHQYREGLTETISKRQDQIKDLIEKQKSGWAKVQPLMETADATSVTELTSAVDLSNQSRTLRSKLDDVLNSLSDQGDGLSIEVLERECLDVEPDTIQAREQQAEAELKGVDELLHDDIAAHTEAQKELDLLAMGTGDGSIDAAIDGAEALASMNEIVEHYLRVWTASTLMRWAIDRYRQEKQAPMLKQAGSIFSVLTNRSFDSLEVRFDEQDKMHLTGIRPDGEEVAVPGLSSGTEDQLFLALRIAAIQDYIDRALSLPFVADDLFINFDEERAAAGFEVLRHLSEKTQILFFTHHEHLVTIAQEVLGNDVHLVTLEKLG